MFKSRAHFFKTGVHDFHTRAQDILELVCKTFKKGAHIFFEDTKQQFLKDV